MLKPLSDLVGYADTEIISEKFYDVSTATTVYCNTELIFQHFPFLTKQLSSSSDNTNRHSIASKWLTSTAGVISKPHLLTNTVHDVIQTSTQPKIGYRPPRYNRACILPIEESTKAGYNFVDIKGCGLPSGSVPIIGKRKTGLVTLGEALQELANLTLLNLIFANENVDVCCVPIYGILDLGFNGHTRFGRNIRSASIVRQAHLRPKDNYELPKSDSIEENVKHKIEIILRKYGITSAVPTSYFRIWKESNHLICSFDEDILGAVPSEYLEYHLNLLGLEAPQTFFVTNVQMTKTCFDEPLQARLIDFGHYLPVKRDEHNGLVTFVDDKPMNWGMYLDQDSVKEINEQSNTTISHQLFDYDYMPREIVKKLNVTQEHDVKVPGSMRLGYILAHKYINENQQINNIYSEIKEWVDLILK